jgi:hypothetical protein
MNNCHPERSEGPVWVGGTRPSRPHRFLATLGMTTGHIVHRSSFIVPIAFANRTGNDGPS